MPRRGMLTFNVRPRYGSGSSAAVNEETALHAAEGERSAYQHALSGTYGEEEKKRAEHLGLGRTLAPEERCLVCGISFEKHPERASFPKVHNFEGMWRSVVEETEEHGGTHWIVRDLLTGEIYQRPFLQSTETQRRNMVKCTRCIQEIEAARIAASEKE